VNRVLRSILVINERPDAANAVNNFQVVSSYKLEFVLEEDANIFEAIRNHVLTYREVPTLQDLKDKFETEGDIAASSRLDDIEGENVYIRGSFEALVADKLEEQRQRHLITLAKETLQIAGGGLRRGKTTLKGVTEAAHHFTQGADQLLSVVGNVKLRGDITEDKEDFIAETRDAHENPGSSWGCMCGIVQMDKVCKGTKQSEMHIHAAYSGGLKTTFALNWAYFCSVFMKKNIIYFTMEMSYPQVRRILYIIHSTHWKFTDPVSAGGLGWEPIDYVKVRDGELTEEELKKLEFIAEDFNSGEYGSLIIEKPEKEVTIADIRFRTEAENRKQPIDIVFIDYLQLVKCSDLVLRTTTERQNEVAREAKNLASNFNGGAGIAVVSLWQTNNVGYKSAQEKMKKKRTGSDEHEQLYDMTTLSWANEAKNAADSITYTYVDEELRQANEAILGCMKNRDNPLFNPVSVKVMWSQRRLGSILDPTDIQISGSTGEVVDLDLDA